MRDFSKSKEKGIAIYHAVYEHEDFETTARILIKLLCNAQAQFPGKKRYLYLDIEGHRNEEGGFDWDMFELQCHFMMEVLMPYLTEVIMPFARLANKHGQKNDVLDAEEFAALAERR